MFRFNWLHSECERRGLILEKISRTYDGVRYRYEIVSNTKGISADCRTLNEVFEEMVALS